MTGLNPGLIIPTLGQVIPTLGQDDDADGDDKQADERQAKLDEQTNILSELCSKATTAVRDCLRKYDNSKQHWQITNALGQESKKALVETLAYLGVPDMDRYLATELPKKLFCRIQNILPDICHICNTQYCIKVSDMPVISCVKCGQGCHNECILKLVGKTEEDLVGLNQADREAIVNPHATIGLFYVCVPCQESTIPQKNEGLKKNTLKTTLAKSTKRDDTPPSDEQNVPQNVDPVQGNATKNVTFEIAQHSAAGTKQPTQSEVSHAVIPEPTSDPAIQNRNHPGILLTPDESHNSKNLPPATVCKHYKRTRCKYGVSGKKEGEGSCPYFHPKPCKKLMEHGNRGPRGCKKGEQCNLFHPQMCHSSLRQRICIDPSCKFNHVRGTKRTQVDIQVGESNNINYGTDTAHQNTQQFPRLQNVTPSFQHATDYAPPPLHQSRNHATKQNDPNPGYFLDALLQLKDEILKEMDKKMQLLQSQTYPQVYPNHHMYNQSYQQTLPQQPIHPTYTMPKPMMHQQIANPVQMFH